MGLARARAPARSSWSATSTAAASSPPCSARSRCCAPSDQALVGGFRHQQVPRRRRAAAPGLDMIPSSPDGRRYGVLPFYLDLWLDAEDSLGVGQVLGRPRPARHDGCGSPWCACRASPTPPTSRRSPPSRACGSASRSHRRRARRRRPASSCPGPRPRSTTWAGCASAGWPTRSRPRRAPARRVLGICGGFQMLGRGSTTTSSPRGRVAGLGLLPVHTTYFAPDKSLRRPRGRGDWLGHRGHRLRDPPRACRGHRREPLLRSDDGEDGCLIRAAILGTRGTAC